MKNLKVIIAILVIGILFSSCASSKQVSEPVEYSEVVEVAGISKNNIFVKANMWFVDTFNNAESVVQYSDKESGIIKGKYQVKNDLQRTIIILDTSTTITVEVKENKYRITFSDPYWYYRSSDTPMSGKVTYVSEAETLIKQWKVMASNLKSSIVDDTDASW